MARKGLVLLVLLGILWAWGCPPAWAWAFGPETPHGQNQTMPPMEGAALAGQASASPGLRTTNALSIALVVVEIAVICVFVGYAYVARLR